MQPMGDGAQLASGVGAAMKLSGTVLIAEEHRLQDAPSLIERPAAAGIVVRMPDHVEFSPFIPSGQEGGANPLEVRHFDGQRSADPQHAGHFVPDRGFFREAEVLEHMFGQHRVHRSVGVGQSGWVYVGDDAGGAGDRVDIDPAEQRVGAAADMEPALFDLGSIHGATPLWRPPGRTIRRPARRPRTGPLSS